MTLALVVSKKVHAHLAPSKAHCWLPCPGSARLQYDDPETEWAAEGTRKHAVLALVLQDKPVLAGDTIATECGPYVVPLEVLEQCHEVKAFIDQFRATRPGWTVETETRVEVGSYAWNLEVGECAGTADAVAYDDKELLVLDAKFGFVRVEARGNPQLMLYALGLLSEIPFPIEHVTLCIAQPDYDGTMEYREHRVTAQYVREWALDQLAVVEEIRAGSYRLQADDHACRYCPARTQCPARLQAMEQIQNEEWMQEAPLEELLPLLPRIRQICKDLELRAIEKLNQGHEVRGWKLVASESKRRWPLDGEEQVAASLASHFGAKKPTEEMYTKKLKSPAQMEKALRAVSKRSVKAAKEIVDLHAIKPAGAPKLVKADDPRPALAAATWSQEDILNAQLEASTFEDNT